MNCPICHNSAGFRVKLADAGPQRTCNGCGAVIPAGHSPEDRQDEAPQAAPAPVVSAIVAAAEPAPAKPVRNASEPLNVLTAARARLRFVKAELRRLKSLETERAQLERIIAAATESKPARAATVRAIR